MSNFITLCYRVQGRCLHYQPQWQSFPPLHLRCDMAVTAVTLDAALVAFGRQVALDAAELGLTGKHSVQDIVLQVSSAWALSGATCLVKVAAVMAICWAEGHPNHCLTCFSVHRMRQGN